MKRNMSANVFGIEPVRILTIRNLEAEIEVFEGIGQTNHGDRDDLPDRQERASPVRSKELRTLLDGIARDWTSL